MAPRKPRSKREENALKWRALGAFIRFAQPGELAAPVDDTRVSVVEVGGKLYITITVGKRTLAVYRVRADEQLKRMRRPPRELRGDEE